MTNQIIESLADDEAPAFDLIIVTNDRNFESVVDVVDSLRVFCPTITVQVTKLPDAYERDFVHITVTKGEQEIQRAATNLRQMMGVLPPFIKLALEQKRG